MKVWCGVRVLLALVASLSLVSADENLIRASSLVTCMQDAQFSAQQFDVVFTPGNRTVTYNIIANVEFSGRVSAKLTVYAYGFAIITKEIDPCTLNLKQLCPFNAGNIEVQSHSELSESVVSQIPGIAYKFPDIDVVVFAQVFDSNGTQVACIQVDATNGKTVNHVAVKWATAVIAGIGLLTSAVASTWGNSYSAAHIATNALALFAYFQSVVIICMEASDRVPPMASSWAQNIVWSMGFIRVGFMQDIYRWYVQATGGIPTTYIKFPTIPILLQKRARVMHDRAYDYMFTAAGKVKRALSDVADYVPTSRLQRAASSGLSKYGNSALAALARRSDTETTNGNVNFEATSSSTLLVLRGIKRVAYQTGIEPTSIVLTGFTFFVFICFVTVVAFILFRGIVALLHRTGMVSEERATYFRYNWHSMLKGTVLRIVYLAFPQILILALWEFIQRDSPAVIVLAVFFLLVTAGVLGWNVFKVWVLGHRSMLNHGTPAYLLYSDSQVVNKYGFLYMQFKATHYYFVVVLMSYVAIKACFISFGQPSGKFQGIALFVVELAHFIIIAVKKPYMDKATNVINIAMAVVMTLNAFFFIFFSNIFGAPRAVASVMGVVFFILNAVFSLVLLIFTLVTCTIVFLSKNPDARYKPAADDRASFIQDPKQGGMSSGTPANEFTALGDAALAGHEQSEFYEPRSRLSMQDQQDLDSNLYGSGTMHNSSIFDRNSYRDSINEDTQGLSPGIGHARTDSVVGLTEGGQAPASRWSTLFRKH